MSAGAQGSLFSRRRFRIARRAIGGALLRGLGPLVVRVLSRSWRTEVHGPEAAPASGGLLISLWHGNMLVGMHRYRGRGWNVLVSPSDDGDLSGRLLRRFGYGVIRGSASRGGARALREMLEHLGRGECVILTPDGPRGPRHSMNPGVAWMARATRHPIVPLGLVCDRAWHLKSWDRFTLPKPFARVVCVWGEPVHVPRDATSDDLAVVTAAVRDTMLALESQGREHLALGEERA